MSVSMKSLGIEQLTVAERLDLVEELWDSIAASTPVTDSQEVELDRRLADHAANPDDVVPWEEVRSSIKTRFARLACASGNRAHNYPLHGALG